MEPRILFVIYTPFEGYLPKRVAELGQHSGLDKVKMVFVTPLDYEEKLPGLVADTVHLIKLYPDIKDVEPDLFKAFYANEERLSKYVELIKAHNI